MRTAEGLNDQQALSSHLPIMQTPYALHVFSAVLAAKEKISPFAEIKMTESVTTQSTRKCQSAVAFYEEFILFRKRSDLR